MALPIQVLLRPRFTFPTLTLLGFGGVLLFTRVIPSGFTPYAVIFVTLGMWLGFWALLGSWFIRLRQQLSWQDISLGCFSGFLLGWLGAYLSDQMTALEALVSGGTGGAIVALVGGTFGFTPLVASSFFSFAISYIVAVLLDYLRSGVTIPNLYFSIIVPLLFCYRIGVMIENTNSIVKRTPSLWLEDFIRVSRPEHTSLPRYSNHKKIIDIN